MEISARDFQCGLELVALEFTWRENAHRFRVVLDDLAQQLTRLLYATGLIALLDGELLPVHKINASVSRINGLPLAEPLFWVLWQNGLHFVDGIAVLFKQLLGLTEL